MNRNVNGARRRLHARSVATALLVLLALLLAAPEARAAGTIALDGLFGDWAGQTYVDDEQGDGKNDGTDLQRFYFSTNPDDETAYFMAERWDGWAKPIMLRLYVDTNNNGIYNESVDRLVEVWYRPNQNDSSVDVDCYNGSGAFLSNIISNANWGESVGEGARRVEWGVSFALLGTLPGQPVRVELETSNGGDVADFAPEVQWSPADGLGLPLLAALALAGAVGLAYQRRCR
jgi:hypothetical protein